MLFYIYCVEMHMSEREFEISSPAKVLKMIDIYHDKVSMETQENYQSKYFSQQIEVQTVSSMKDVEGFL